MEENGIGCDLMTLCYCKKCGRIILILSSPEDEYVCDYCNSKVFPVPKEFLKSTSTIDVDKEQHFFDEYIKKSPEFDQYLFESREKYKAKHANDFAKYNAAIEHGKRILEERSHQPECPTCHSKNVQRISGLERGVSIIGLGIFSKKINKNFKCKNCGYTW